MKLDRSLLSPGDSLLVALSGGPDSLALLHALCALRHEWQLDLSAVHVHHGMRGAEADADVASLEQLCAAWKVPLFVERADVPALARLRGFGIEEAGREARYSAFARLCDAGGIRKVATAHHADDQAESVLLNLFRGGGMDGLAGIPRRRRLTPGVDVEVIRPLLDVSRRTIEDYCRAHGLTPLFDRTNDDPHFLRNQVRKELLPLLEALDPAVRRHLVRLSAQVRDELELLELHAAALLQAAEQPSPTRWVRRGVAATGPWLAADTLTSAAVATARRTVRHLLRGFGEGVEIDEILVERVLSLARGEVTAVEIPGVTVRLRRRGNLLQTERTRVDVPVPEPLTILTKLDASGGHRIKPTIASQRASNGPVRPEDGRLQRGDFNPSQCCASDFDLTLELRIIPEPVPAPQPPHQALLDADALTPPLILRPPARGDRFRPLGAPGTRLLSDVLSERGVPANERPYWPLVCDQSGIVWVVGHTIADRAKITASSRYGLEISVTPDPE